MELKVKLEDSCLNGLKRNNFFIYNIYLEKDEEERYHFTVRSLFLRSILGSIPLSSTIIYQVTSVSYKRKNIKFNIILIVFLVMVIGLVFTTHFVGVISTSSETLILRIISMLATFILLCISPSIFLLNFMKQYLNGINEIEFKS